MVVYGWRTSRARDFVLPQSKCESCGQTGKSGAVFWSYVHIFWIPIFPYKKIVVTQCNHCQHQQEGNFDPEVQMQIEQHAGSTKPPVWMFAGLAIIAVLIGVVAFQSNANADFKANKASDPQVGDVFVIRDVTENPLYPCGMLQVWRTDSDSIWFFCSKYLYTEAEGFEDDMDKNLHKDTAYWVNDMYWKYDRTDILDWQNAGNIKAVYENQPVYVDTSWTGEVEAWLDSLRQSMDSLQLDSLVTDTAY